MGIVEIVLAVCVGVLFLMVLLLNRDRQSEYLILRNKAERLDDAQGRIKGEMRAELRGLRKAAHTIEERMQEDISLLLDHLDVKYYKGKLIPKDQNWVYIEEDK